MLSAALRTGMKCLPTAKIPQAAGTVLHDWHAEILAIRAFNHFLLQECLLLSSSPERSSTLVRRREIPEISQVGGLQPFTIRENVKIHMYSSEAPCGDASMEFVMDAQSDPTPWPIAPESLFKNQPSKLKGRESFSELGIVRRKPCTSRNGMLGRRD